VRKVSFRMLFYCPALSLLDLGKKKKNNNNNIKTRVVEYLSPFFLWGEFGFSKMKNESGDPKPSPTSPSPGHS